jgi:5-hydroxyisourate hydrolase-like protein (transthyretin family)
VKKHARTAGAALVALALLGLVVWLLSSGDDPATGRPHAPGGAGGEAVTGRVDLEPPVVSASGGEASSGSTTDAAGATAQLGPRGADLGAAPARVVDPATAFLTGVVRGPDGRGLPGATVVLEGLNAEMFGESTASARAMMLEQARRMGVDQGYFVAAGDAVTDDQGRFALGAPTAGADPMRVRIVHHEHLPVRSRDVTRAALAAARAIDVTLPRGATVLVDLRTPDGAPPVEPAARLVVDARDRPTLRASGALTFEYDLTAASLALWSEPRADGSRQGTLLGAPPGQHGLVASAAGHPPRRVTVAVPDGGTASVDVLLEAGLSIRGKVVDGAGAPIAGADLFAYPAEVMDGQLDPEAMRPYQATSDADGAFTLRGLEERGYALGVTATGYVQRGGVPAVHRPGGEPVVLTLAATRRLRGRVVLEGTTDSAGPGIEVEVEAVSGPWSGGSAGSATTDEDGAFEVADLDGKRFLITARGRGLTTADRVPVTLPDEGEATEVLVPVRPGATLTVTVLDKATRRPLADASVWISRPGGATGVEETTTGADGRVPLRGLAPGEWTLSVTHEGHATTTRKVLVRSGDPAPMVVELAPGGRVRLRVVDAGGAPAAGQRILLMVGGQFDAGAMGVTDDDGRCEIGPLSAATYAVQGIFETGAGQSLTPLGQVEVAEGAIVELELRAGGKARLRGQVLRGARPLASAPVMVTAPSGDFLDGYGWSTTDGAGRFEVELSPGQHRVWTAGAEPRLVDLAPGASVEVTLEVRAGTVAGRVLGRDGKPVEGVRVLLRRTDGEVDALTELADLQALWTDQPSDALGRYELDRVRPGRYRLVASAPGVGAVVGDELTIGEDDARLGLDLVLSPGARLEVALTREDGTPAAGALVMLYHHGLRLPDGLLSAWGGAARTADARGRVVIEDALPGDYAVAGGSELSGVALAERVSCAAGGTTSVPLDLRSPGALVVAAAPGTRVTVTLPGGAPAAPALAMVPLAVGPSGELTVPGLPAGHAFVVRGTTADGRALAPASVTLVTGAPSRVVLE